MSTGYGCEGLRQVYATRCVRHSLVHFMYLSASVVALSTWVRYNKCYLLPLSSLWQRSDAASWPTTTKAL